MGATGSTTVDFGAFPGKSDATVDVATAGVVSTSLIEAWILPIATASHSVDEHVVETIRAVGYFLSAGNIRIRVMNTNQVNEPYQPGLQTSRKAALTPPSGTPKGTRVYGIWTVAWAWL